MFWRLSQFVTLKSEVPKLVANYDELSAFDIAICDFNFSI